MHRTLNGRPIFRPFPGADHLIGNEPCPHCTAQPVRIYVSGRQAAGFGTYTEAATCARCEKPIGVIIAKVDYDSSITD